MSRVRFLGMSFVVLAGAFAGGYVANRAVPVAHAQDVILPGEVRGTSFTLVNQQGQVEASLRNGASGAELTLNDANGKTRVEVSPSGGVVIRDAMGRVMWRTPRRVGIVPAAGGE